MSDPSTLMGVNEVEALLLGAGLATVVAIWALFSQRAIAARQATLSFIREGQSDRDILKAREVFNALSRHPDGIHQFANKPLEPGFQSIITTLNQYEIVAIGVQRGIFDDTTYRRWHRSGVVRSWEAAAPFILARRRISGNDALWHEFEEMARWYRGAPPMPHRRFIWRKFL
jgi:Domain of unknown function (DUF4760)